MRRLLIGCTLVGALTVFAAAPASAHTALIDASPGPGDVVPTGLEVVVLELEGVQRDGDHVMALSADDVGLKVGDAVAVDDRTVCARVEPLQVGVHAIEYEAVSADGHPVQGRYLFEVVDGTDGPPPVPAGCEVASLPAPDEVRSLGLEVQDVPGWVAPAMIMAVVLAAVAAIVTLVRRRREGDQE